MTEAAPAPGVEMLRSLEESEMFDSPGKTSDGSPRRVLLKRPLNTVPSASEIPSEDSAARLEQTSERRKVLLAHKIKPGQTIRFAHDLAAEVLTREGGEVRLRFDCEGPALRAALEHHGTMPLPPYIPREAGSDASDRDDYQTVYARREGAVAAASWAQLSAEGWAEMDVDGIATAVDDLSDAEYNDYLQSLQVNARPHPVRGY